VSPNATALDVLAALARAPQKIAPGALVALAGKPARTVRRARARLVELGLVAVACDGHLEVTAEGRDAAQHGRSAATGRPLAGQSGHVATQEGGRGEAPPRPSLDRLSTTDSNGCCCGRCSLSKDATEKLVATVDSQRRELDALRAELALARRAATERPLSGQVAGGRTPDLAPSSGETRPEPPTEPEDVARVIAAAAVPRTELERAVDERRHEKVAAIAAGKAKPVEDWGGWLARVERDLARDPGAVATILERRRRRERGQAPATPGERAQRRERRKAESVASEQAAARQAAARDREEDLMVARWYAQLSDGEREGLDLLVQKDDLVRTASPATRKRREGDALRRILLDRRVELMARFGDGT
jgi:hypothetical protein